MSVKAIDLFCGAGGLTCGLQQAGINVVAGIDFDENCEYAYTHNNSVFFLHLYLPSNKRWYKNLYTPIYFITKSLYMHIIYDIIKLI